MTLIISFIETLFFLRLLTLQLISESKKSRVVALLLAVIPGGWHLFYVGKWNLGMIRLIQTFRLYGIVLNIPDIFQIIRGQFLDETGLPL